MTLACLKHLYSAGYQKANSFFHLPRACGSRVLVITQEAYTRLQELVNSDALNPDSKRSDNLTPQAMTELKARCYLKLGSWQLAMMEDVESKLTDSKQAETGDR